MESQQNLYNEFVKVYYETLNRYYYAFVLMSITMGLSSTYCIVAYHQNMSLFEWFFFVAIIVVAISFVLVCSAANILMNSQRKAWVIKHLKKSKLFTKETPSELPRTWGKELFLLIDRQVRKECFDFYYILALLGLIDLPLSVHMLIFDPFHLNKIIAVIFILLLAPIEILLLLMINQDRRRFLLPIYFQRMANKKLKQRDDKLEAIKKQLPENRYRIASLSAPQDIEQVRALLKADHPLSHEQHEAAQAVIEAHDELETAQKYAELSQTQGKPTTS